MKKLNHNQIELRYYTPIRSIFSKNPIGKFTIQMDWFEDTPVYKNYYNDLTESAISLNMLEIISYKKNTYNISQKTLKLKDNKIYNYGNFGMIKGRSIISFDASKQGDKKMENGISNKIKNYDKVVSFLQSDKEQENFNIDGEHIQVIKLKEEPKYMTYWFKIDYMKYSKAVVFNDISNMEELAKELAESIDRKKKNSLTK